MRIPSYRRHSLRNLGFAEHKGVRTYFPGPYNSRESKAAYAKWLRAILDHDGETPPDPTPDATVDELVQAFLDHAAVYYGENHEYTQLKYATKPLLELHGETPVAQFGPRALKAVRSLMVTGEWAEPPRPWCRPYINHQVNRLRRIFKWGVSVELVPASVLQALKSVAPLEAGRTAAREPAPIAPVDQEHIDAVLPHVGPQVAAMMGVQRLTGMRSENVCLMRPADIDRSGDVWIYRPKQHKGAWRGKILTVFLGPKCQELLHPFLDRPADAYLFSPRESEEWRHAKRRAERNHERQDYKRKPHPQRPKRDHYDPDSYRQAINYGIAKANRKLAKANEKLTLDHQKPLVPHWHPHRLRHAVGTLVRSKYGLEASQVFLGHASADVTQIYAERDLALARRVAKDIA